jgi:hypothetical protein
MRMQQQQLLPRHTVAANAVQRLVKKLMKSSFPSVEPASVRPCKNAGTFFFFATTAAARIQLSRVTLVRTCVHSANARAAAASEAIAVVACHIAIEWAHLGGMQLDTPQLAKLAHSPFCVIAAGSATVVGGEPVGVVLEIVAALNRRERTRSGTRS